MAKRKKFEPDPGGGGSSAKVGDRCLLQTRQNGPWYHATVTATHLTGGHACADIEVKYDSGRVRVVGPYDIGRPETGKPRIIILPPEDEIPKEVKDYAREYNLTVARRMVNYCAPMYRFMHPSTLEECYLGQEESTSAEFYYDEDRGWCNGKWEIGSCSIHVVRESKCEGDVEECLPIPEDMEPGF